MIHLTDITFDTFIAEAGLPLIIDCWSFRHEPCRINAPLVDELSNQYSGKLVVGKLNVEENPYTAGKYNITIIPAILYFINGKLCKKFIGNITKDKLIRELAELW